MAWRNPWYTETVPEVDPFIEGLKEKGCHYNEEEDSWERVWVVATRDVSERSSEVYRKKGGKWKVTMYGNDDNVFFEQEVDPELMLKEREERSRRIKKEQWLLSELRGKYGDNYENYTY